MAARVRQAGIVEVSDISKESPKLFRPLIQREGIRAFVGISLRSDGDEIGVLYVNFRRPRQVSESERVIIRRHAQKATQVILEGRRSTRVELPALLRQITQNAKELLEADIVTLYEYRHGHDEEFVTPPAVSGELRVPGIMATRIYDDDAPALLVRRGKPYYADNVTTDEFLSKISPVVEERSGQPRRPRFIAREGICSSAGVLLRAEDEIVGVMFVNYRTPHPFTKAVKQDIDLFADQAAVGIRNARIFEQTQALREIGQAITSATLEPQRMFELILDRALDLVGFSKGWIS
jgi:GAF domain-containing protein